MSAYAPRPVGSTVRVKHRIARRRIERRIPFFMPRTWIAVALSTPMARPLLRRAYDRYMRSRTHPKYARGMPMIQ
jgi:hypothetical protein